MRKIFIDSTGDVCNIKLAYQQSNISMAMKIVKTSPSNHTFAKRIIGSCVPVPAAWVAALMGLVSILSVQAVVLDNFNGATLTGWTTTPYLNSGTIVQSGGQLNVATAASASALTYGIKTASNYVNAASQTLEFRVDVNTVTPGSDDPNPVAILAWLPSGVGAVPGSGSSGYSLWASPAGATLYHGGTALATTTYTTPYTTNIQSTTLVLRMTPGSGNISVNARVYHQTSNQPMQDFTEVWEYTQTVSDSVGTGNAALGVQSGASASGATVSFDNLQVFVLSDSVLDDFSGGAADLAANYSVSGYPAVATISGGQMELATYPVNTILYAAARRSTSNYEITDGSRLEISVDVVNFGPGATDVAAFGALSYTPFNSDAGIGSLVGYHIGAGCWGLSMGKAYGEWWVNQETYSPLGPDEPIPATNVRLILTMTGEGTSCRIDSRVEDLSVGVNDPKRVLYQNVFVDTAASDPLDTHTTPNAPDGYGLPFGSAAYLNQPGSIALYAFYGGSGAPPYQSDIIFDNLVVNQTAPKALPPSFSSIVPPDRSNFVAVATGVSFNVNDAINTPVNNISLTLNGVKYANGSGATVGPTATSRTFTLSPNPLVPL
jgi:hypothetical protein